MIVSTTITSNRAAIIGDALRSVVVHVDACLILDIGADDATIQVARDVCGAKLVIREIDPSTPFAEIRNAALALAHEIGGKWAITLDTDERVHLPASLRADLEADRDQAMDVLIAPKSDRSYTKERIFRLPARGRWVESVHEAFVLSEPRNIRRSADITFDELPKSPERLKENAAAYVPILRDQVARNPDQGRWHYYLGDSLALLGDAEGAFTSFLQCMRLPTTWDEIRAWSAFRAAVVAYSQGGYAIALDLCAAGLAIRADMAELCWLAGMASARLGMIGQVLRWAALVETTAKAADGRIGFCDHRIVREGAQELRGLVGHGREAQG